MDRRELKRYLAGEVDESRATWLAECGADLDGTDLVSLVDCEDCPLAREGNGEVWSPGFDRGDGDGRG
jgi:hypothetical protein